ncbi:MAG: DUF1330 domain-containing protein [Pseudomonadota bacterium]
MPAPTHANLEISIDPTADQVRAMRDADQDAPVVMLNLLKFRDKALYPEGSGLSAPNGMAAYKRYQLAFTETVAAVSCAEVVYDGPCEQVFIGALGAPETDWDKMLIVRYPARKHFLAMMADSAYRAALVHRYAGLERTVLIQCAG